MYAGRGLLLLAHQLWQLCYSASKVPRLIARELDQSPAVLIFEVNAAQYLSIAVPHDKTRSRLFDGPRGGMRQSDFVTVLRAQLPVSHCPGRVEASVKFAAHELTPVLRHCAPDFRSTDVEED
jgi:hypothetical protein